MICGEALLPYKRISFKPLLTIYQFLAEYTSYIVMMRDIILFAQPKFFLSNGLSLPASIHQHLNLQKLIQFKTTLKRTNPFLQKQSTFPELLVDCTVFRKI